MKKLILSATLVLGLIITGNLKAQQAMSDPNVPSIVFEHDTIDYGTIAHNAPGTRTFKFTNVGKEPLIIKDVKGSCGCTVPQSWPKEPVQPGQTGEIPVHYATDRVGQFIKTVTITSNAPTSKIIVIKGNVLPDAATATSSAATK